jgi:hypothetical protein
MRENVGFLSKPTHRSSQLVQCTGVQPYCKITKNRGLSDRLN